MNRCRRIFSLAVALTIAAFTTACPGLVSECECFFVDRAIALTVVESGTMRGVDDFFVELILNDVPQGEPQECDPTFREEGNACSFGSEAGIYHIIVRAPGFQTTETVARVATEDNSTVCCNARIGAKQVEVRLDEVTSP